MKATLGLVMMVALCGCTKSGAPATEAAEVEAEAPLPEAQIAALLDAVPEDAWGVSVVATRAPLWDSLTGGFLLPMDPQIKEQLDAELAAHLEKALGLDYRRAQAMVLFARAQPPKAAVLVSGIDGELANSTGEYGGASIQVLDDEDDEDDFILAKLGDVLLLGDESEVHGSIDRIASKARSHGALRKHLDEIRVGANFAAVVNVEAIPQAAMLPVPGKIRHASVRAGLDGARVTVTGDATALDFLEVQFGVLEQAAMAEARAQKESAVGDVAEGAGAILAYHYLANAAEQLEPVRAGDELSIELALAGGGNGTAMTVTTVVGVLAATAIPAFQKYITKSKTTEARQLVQRLYAGASVHYSEKGKLPADVGPTPPIGSCCQGEDEKCAPNPALWSDPAWQALGFSVDDAHYYSYEYRKQEGGFTVTAYGDLDCDGVYSTWTMQGQLDAGATAGMPPVIPANELE